jgi:hypothetical protein
MKFGDLGFNNEGRNWESKQNVVLEYLELRQYL